MSDCDSLQKYSFKNVITFNMDEYVFPETSSDRPSAKNPNVRTSRHTPVFRDTSVVVELSFFHVA